MEDELIDSSRLSLSRKSQLPGAGFFYPDSLDEDRSEERVEEAVEDAEVVVVADTDADGLGCVALLREAYDAALDADSFEEDIAERIEQLENPVESDEEDAEADADALEDEDVGPNSSVALVGSGPYSLEDELDNVAEYAPEGVEVFVCDLCPDKYEYVDEELDRLVETASSVRWFDHHQWNDDVAAAVREAGVELVVGESDEECSTDVTLRSLDYEFDDRFRELAEVTRDHDLWIREDPRSDDLADYAYWTGAEEYVTIVGTYGADLPDVATEFVELRRVEKENLIDRAVSRAELKSVGPWTVGVTYGRCSQNEVAEALRERGADAAVVVKPAGSASIRGTDDFELCHEVAGQVNGGGHPKAAGCKPDIYDDMLDYANHWTTQGSAAKRVILAAFERVAERFEAGAYDDDEGVETER
ncbi:Oligoribonuclease NrnB or cAMP/cGMP phosphodiesterase, DHH superfamily [Halopelagius inordinatus]|uniref:Oligoribonuclease NrnB or cAMP/cGMP phosphodiesterase, DHH superfamily n=1 Tax=Halopelagius inordinatus TaxID=553467 RepID=A0A1I2WP59_9EURY|nr:phosphohydrolase [Halopelagius inordinatus]SFH03123.1 Oligoribonuclease NrnB or cAMP/cGMP phosphodiesterase, DHH superfamily [Halopelagius inordinatus]